MAPWVLVNTRDADHVNKDRSSHVTVDEASAQQKSILRNEMSQFHAGWHADRISNSSRRFASDVEIMRFKQQLGVLRVGHAQNFQNVLASIDLVSDPRPNVNGLWGWGEEGGVKLFLVPVTRHCLKKRTTCTENEWNKVERGFSNQCNFPQYVGAVDRKHLMIKCPKKSAKTRASSMGLMKLGDGDGGIDMFVILAGVSGGSRKGTAFSERVISVALRTCLKLMSFENSSILPSLSVITGEMLSGAKSDLLDKLEKV
uniref:Uncharacterized protein n=1 Tax=Timema poppense TaxID=170557 RepID=A0A7R9DD71_TIMPO|nr:unnamed protein product [Timema poppensis]